MKKRHKKQKLELPVKQPVIVEERKGFGYLISESLSREQRGKFRGMLE